MLDFGSGELVVIGVVALVAIGPKELPGLLRTVGQAIGKLRRMAGDFQNQFNDALREADMADAQKMISDIKTDFSTTMTGSGSMSPPIVMPTSETDQTKSESVTTDGVSNEIAPQVDDALALALVDEAQPVTGFTPSDGEVQQTPQSLTVETTDETMPSSAPSDDPATAKTQAGVA